MSSVDVEEGKSHASYLAPELQQEVVAHCPQTAAEFMYLKPYALQLKLSWGNKMSVKTILAKSSTDSLLTTNVDLGVHISNSHSP